MSRLRGGGGCVRGRCVREAEGRVEGSAEGHRERGGWWEGCQRSSLRQLQGRVCFEKGKRVERIPLKRGGKISGMGVGWVSAGRGEGGEDPLACGSCVLGVAGMRVGGGRAEGNAEGHHEGVVPREGCQQSSWGQLQDRVDFEKGKRVERIPLKNRGKLAGRGGGCASEGVPGVARVAGTRLPEVSAWGVACLRVVCVGRKGEQRASC